MSKKIATSGKASSPTGDDAGQAELQQIQDAANERGYFGYVPDPTPNENYSLETPPDAPTPETDAGLEAEARKASGVGVGALEGRERAKSGGNK